MMKNILLVFSLLGLFCVCLAQIDQDGQCDLNVGLQENFNIDEFLGTWYELRRTANPHNQGKCAAFHLTRNQNPQSSNIINVLYDSVNDNFAEESTGTITVPEDGSAKLSLSLSAFPNAKQFWVRLTDFETVALTFSCENLPQNRRRVHIWVLGKQNHLPSGLPVNLINTALNNLFDISLEQLEVVSHTPNDCVKLPVIGPNQPVLLDGQCDQTIPVVQNFNVADFTGLWHQISRYHNDHNQGACIRAEYSSPVNGVVSVLNSEVRNGELVSITGQATPSTNDNSGKLTVTLNLSTGGTATQDLWVIDTDYKKYAVAYACVNLPATNQKRVFSWVLSRSRRLPEESEDAVNKAIDSVVELNRKYYQITDQSDSACFFYPNPVENTPVVFRGQCESVNVQAMGSFNVGNFMGTWNTIEMYPASSQGGTCSNAFYELTADNKVNVVNSHVVGQELLTASAVAVLASDDGTAKLEVTFPSSPTPFLLWVLATDYQNYAFTYSCTNINEDEMRVVSWKLSKTKELNEDSIRAINEVIDRVSVLDQRYYERMPQTVEDCFYFPKAEPGVTVRFPGSCDDNVPILANLDFGAFDKTWYEVESYPKSLQPGQCISHEFIPSGTTGYNVESYSIYDQFVTPLRGVLTRSPTNDGKMTLTIPNANGPDTTIPFWVIGTDYNDYALAYSCQNDNGYRKIWSWKLSRTRTLSPSAITNINNLMQNNVVLDQRYYQTVLHTTSACAYLPELNPGDDIILPGQCDTNIQGIAGFDTLKFSGRWRLIESYATYRQSGTCNVAEYTFVDSRTMTIVNSQVRNQELETRSFTAISANGDGKLTVTISNRSFELIVLDTDYTSYALAYGCTNINENERRIFSWKLSRQNTLSGTAISKINEVVNSIEVLNNRFYYKVDRTQTGCFYYPPVDQSTLVKFRGQCSQYSNIPVERNFNVQEYMGTWYNVETYPVNDQTGSCNTAEYELPATGPVQVLNSEVRNEQLFSISGTAELESSVDNSAKLKVTLNVGGTPVATDLWVLTTNYKDYSLAYSCRDIDDEFMTVSIWKLSRTKKLDPVSSLAITNYMTTIPILDERYFIDRDHSPEGCFYYPEPELGKPVVFPGKCDESIATMAQFNMQQFQGVWHEIEMYPEATRTGQCVNRQFTVEGNGFKVQSSNIDNQILNLPAPITLVPTSGSSGKFTFTVNTNSGPVAIPYWILDTDYQSYALAYSCLPLNEHFRQVWSWKLSKSKTLTSTAQQAINEAIKDIAVLNNDYYEDVDQSERACFHLPPLEAGAPVILPGKCDRTIAGVRDFDINKYYGRWRLIESYGSDFQTGTCNVARYTVQGNILQVVNSQVVGEALTSVSGTARVVSTDGTGKLLFTFPSQSMEVIVLDTDYTDYALAYSCVDLENDQRRVYSWKLSRGDTLSPDATVKINAIINSIDVLHQPYYYTVKRTENDCFYYPPVNPSVPVVFRGQCRDDIPVVQNFDVEKYLKLWHDIESYPMPFQAGSCPNAFYDVLDASTVSVFNTQVIGQTLDTIVGKAVVTSNDNSAKLEVSFEGFVEGTTDYWVLSTDYSTYAFVYSCTNLDDEFMSVVSWKLSRTKAGLTDGATSKINEIIGNYKFLDDRYYIKRDQSPEGCFYYPDYQPGVPVEFPGICDENIQAVSAFDFEKFKGTWHEIQAYPKENQPGQCISHEFTPDSTTSYLLNSFNVFNTQLSKSESKVTYYNNNDNSGKLKIELPNGLTIPYWVLSTDYTNYALVYACVKSRDDYRQVYSWKLSRSKQLTQDDNAKIDEAISKVDVLKQVYYETIQQTENACFYYPVLGPNDPVIFPGRCDANIPVLQGFNSEAYLGHWRLLESYYTSFQEGACNTATYSEGPNDSVIVVNARVNNQELFTITGSAVLATTDGSAKLSVTFPGSSGTADYWILDTDYNDYALIYSCEDLEDDRRRVWSWKMGRRNTLLQDSINKINRIVDSINVLDARYYQKIGRTDADCFYFPTPNPDKNVVFPGQCDQSIPVVQQFNAERFKGTWYDLESYPTGFQSGTCNTANYELNPDNTFNVLNTQIVNQLLQSRPGTASATTTDGSAKFEVSFLINGEYVKRDYWVLETDYQNFAFVYTCRNLDEESREVFSWKLSRTKSFNSASTDAIDKVIQNVDVLQPKYYVKRLHTPEACFYYPDNNGGDVVLYGKCTDDIPYMTSFNAQLFQGTWHEASRFPSDLQDGECTESGFTLDENTNTFNVIQTTVNDEIQTSSVLQATVATDGRGVFTVTSDGVPFNELYVLDTDYDNFAVLYSCRDLDLEEERKQVYSWKLSRRREGFSESVQDTINQIVSDNIDLNEPYYKETGQDSNSCFHYPVLDNPDVIELPEPCNPDITGIPNFDAEAYLGRWFEVERYPQPTQAGQCNRAVYSDLQGATVKVVNSQVLDRRLLSIEGSATASADGSGTLNVNFNVNDEARASNLLVLATDYSSYALVYNCETLDNGMRQVGSWKLSRNKTLSTGAIEKIDAVVAATQGLNPIYYQRTSQEDDVCFYVPEREPLTAPRFRGQCGDVKGIQVDASRFVGWWHEMRRYASDGFAGECISSNYEQSGETLLVVDTNVVGNSGAVNNGVVTTATVTITEDGVLRKVFSNGNVQEIVVLATDYENYALLYSCENDGDEYRRVWSAVHSKTQVIDEAAEEEIEKELEANEVLYKELYLNVDQSPEACFHYPAQTDQPIVLPGQCDATIAGLTNFDAVEFAGNWYQTAQYDPLQGRSCAGSRFTYNSESEELSIVDYFVVNEDLETREATGSASSDGTLTVTWSEAETEESKSMTIRILSTDYTNYAIAYTCVNVGNWRRQVSVWVLSREREMSAAGTQGVNALIAARPELYQNYFREIPQHDECPEPSSAFIFKSSIIVILVCSLLQLAFN